MKNQIHLRIYFLSLLMGVLSCSDASIAKVDVDIAVNQSENPLLVIEQNRKAGLSRGIFFKFQELNCPPASIQDEDSSKEDLLFPSNSNGVSATQTDYAIRSSNLLLYTPYQVLMFSQNTAGVTTHVGFGDCPMVLGIGDGGSTTICFGLGLEPSLQLCPGTLPWGECPTVKDTTYCSIGTTPPQ